jgi:hypothetical protein
MLRKRENKALDKIIEHKKMDVRIFEKTVDEVKQRYYEVAVALLKHRGVVKHKLLDFNNNLFDIEYESVRKCNWERLYTRGKELF